MTITDINDNATIIIDKQAVRAVYELVIYRIVLMASGESYDVSETYAALLNDLPSGGGNV